MAMLRAPMAFLYIDEWQSMHGKWRRLELPVDVIDGSSHEIYLFVDQGRWMYYFGHRVIDIIIATAYFNC